MKIALLFSLALTFAANADQILRLPEDSTAISPLSGEVLSVTPLCPKGSRCRRPGALVHIKFVLRGCADQMARVGFKYDSSGRKLYVSALNIHVKYPVGARCLEAPVKVESFPIEVSIFEPEEVVFLGTDKTESLFNKIND